jgi:hypothetical protein
MIWIILAFGANFISSWIRIRIWNADPDPGDKFNADPYGSGSQTLVTGVHPTGLTVAKGVGRCPQVVSNTRKSTNIFLHLSQGGSGSHWSCCPIVLNNSCNRYCGYIRDFCVSGSRQKFAFRCCSESGARSGSSRVDVDKKIRISIRSST